MPQTDKAARHTYVAAVLGAESGSAAVTDAAAAFAPSNIALVKYWGKRQAALNLPLVSSLSYTLAGYGTQTRIALADADVMVLNGAALEPDDPAARKVFAFLDLFRTAGEFYAVTTDNNIPTAAGVASSASGFAALTLAVARLKGWRADEKALSMLARLGSGSAARSFWPGLVVWHKGLRDDGLDCFAQPAPSQMPDMRMAVLVLATEKKAWSSTKAMQIAAETSPLAARWPVLQQEHLEAALAATAAQDFAALGAVVEENALLMHDMTAQATPSIVFDGPETKIWKEKIRNWRKAGLPVYFTQDAGANLKIMFQNAHLAAIEQKLRAAGVEYFMPSA